MYGIEVNHGRTALLMNQIQLFHEHQRLFPKVCYWHEGVKIVEHKYTFLGIK